MTTINNILQRYFVNLSDRNLNKSGKIDNNFLLSEL